MELYRPQTGNYILWIETVKQEKRKTENHTYKYCVEDIIAGAKIDLKEDPDINLGFIRVSDIPNVTPSPLLMRLNGEEIRINGGFGSTVYVQRYDYWITFWYIPVLTPQEIIDEFESFFQNRGGENVRHRINTLLRKVEVSYDSGYTCLCLLKNVIPDAYGWANSRIIDIDKYRNYLKDGISKGALSPDDIIGWQIFMRLTSSKNPMDMIPDKDMLMGLLDNAIKSGNSQDIREIALRLIDRIK